MNLYLILILFILLIFSCYQVDYYNKKINTIYVAIIIFLFALIVGFRLPDVPDTSVYNEFLTVVDNFTYPEIQLSKFSSFSIGFFFFTKIMALLLNNNKIIYYSIIAIINCLGIILATKNLCYENEKKIPYAVILSLYIAFFGFYYSGITIRAGLAMSLIIISFSYLVKQKTMIGIIFFLVAIIFHASALVGIIILLIPIFNINKGKKFFLYLYVVIGIIYLVTCFFPQLNEFFMSRSIKIADSYYGGYYLQRLLESDFESGFSLKFTFFYLIGAMPLLIKKSNTILNYITFIYYIGLILWVALTLTRISDFYIVFSMFIIYFCLEEIKDKLFRNLLYFIIISGELFLVLRIIYTYGGNNALYFL